MKTSPSLRSGKRFTLIELLVVVAIIAILAGMLLPALNSAREKGRSITCTNNLKSVSLYFHQYCDDNNEWELSLSPGGKNWSRHIGEYAGNVNAKGSSCLLACPTETRMTGTYTGSTSYGLNYSRFGQFAMMKEGKLQWTKRTTLLNQKFGSTLVRLGDSIRKKLYPEFTFSSTQSESTNEYITNGGFVPQTGGTYAPVFARHALKANLLFFDGHAETKTANIGIVW